MRRRNFLLAAVTAALARADTLDELTELLRVMAAALSESNAEVFLRGIDPAIPGYERFAANVRALAAEYELSNTIDFRDQKGDDRVQMLELDWLLDIKGKGASLLFVRREQIVKLRLERQKKKWRIVSLEPLSFFDPPGPEANK
jgi:hypothetical protein